MDSLLLFVFVCVCVCFLPCCPPSPHHCVMTSAPLPRAVTCSLRSFSSDRSNTLNRSSFARDSMMIEEILAPTKDTVSPVFSPLVSFPLFIYFFITTLFNPCSLHFMCVSCSLYSPPVNVSLTFHTRSEKLETEYAIHDSGICL